jgi:hypothetical protein
VKNTAASAEIPGGARSAVAKRARRSPVKEGLVRVMLLVAGAILGAVLYAYAPELLRTASSEPPHNFVPVSDRIDTSGQPSPAQLAGLKQKGYGLVINLAPPNTVGSIAEEGLLVG